MSSGGRASTDPGALATRPVGTRFRAVQQDIAVTVVDWPVVHAWSEDDPDFVGAVTVLDEAGAQLATTTGRPRPTWRRTGRWAGSGGSGSGRGSGTGWVGGRRR
jgi:hypothetical protein